MRDREVAIAERIGAAVVCAVLGLIIVLALLYWCVPPGWALIVVPLACAVAGAVAGDRAIDALKHVCGWGVN